MKQQPNARNNSNTIPNRKGGSAQPTLSASTMKLVNGLVFLICFPSTLIIIYYKGMISDSNTLTTFQKKQLLKTVQAGKPLPTAVHPTASKHIPAPEIIQKQAQELTLNVFGQKSSEYAFRRKKLEQMLKDGSFQMDEYRPLPAKFDREKEKQKLSTLFQFNCDLPESAIPLLDPQNFTPTPTQTKKQKSRMEELLEEVEDRASFLHSMHALGNHSYDSTITMEMREKLEEMKRIESFEE